MDARRQFEICQEARFVLWALRCAIAAERGDRQALSEIGRGFELADVAETEAAFHQFARLLARFEWPPSVWHHPHCCCVSTEEMFVLQALARTAERQRVADSEPDPWWRRLLPAVAIAPVEAGARWWLAALDRAGIVFPSPADLMECLRPLEAMVEPARIARMH